MDLTDGYLKAMGRLDALQSIASICGLGAVPACRRFARRLSWLVAACFTDSSLVVKLLGWRVEFDLAVMCHDHWRWQEKNQKVMCEFSR